MFTIKYHYEIIPAESYQAWADAAAAQEHNPVLPKDRARLLEEIFSRKPQSLGEYRRNLGKLEELQMEIFHVFSRFQRETSGMLDIAGDYEAQFKD